MKQICLITLLSYWQKKPLQLIALVTGLAVATALWTAVQAINAEARVSYNAAASLLSDGQYDQLLPTQNGTIHKATYVKLRRAGWLVSPVLDGRFENIRLIGFEYLTAPKKLKFFSSTKNNDVFTQRSTYSLFTNAETSKKLDVPYPIVVDATIAPDVVIGDIGIIQEILQRNDISRLLVLPNQPIGQTPLAELTTKLRLKQAQQTADISQLTKSFHLNLSAFGLLSFAVGLFIVYSTVGLAFEQRRDMFRILRILGVSIRMMTIILILEVLIISGISAVLGILFGYIIAAALLPDVAATLQGLYGAQIASTLSLRNEWWLSGIGLAMLGACLAFADRIWQVTNTPLAAYLRPRKSATVNQKTFKVLGWISIVLFTSAILIVLFMDGLAAGFLVLACLLLGAAFALPTLITHALCIFEQYTRSPFMSWFLADTRHQLPLLNLALMALLLAISANIGVTTMVSSFRLTFSTFLDQRLAPELYIEVDDEAQSLALSAFLTTSRIEFLPIISMSRKFGKEVVRVNGVSVGPTYRQNWTFLDSVDDPWNQVESGSAIIINEQLARRAKLKIGDTISLNETLTLPIAAVFGDYGNPNGQVITSISIINSIQPELFVKRFGIRTDDIETLTNELIAALNLEPNQISDQASLKLMSMKIFDRTFEVTEALNFLTLSVAGLSLLISLFIMNDLRIPQLAPAWALGLEWRKISFLEIARTLALSTFVYVCALPVGLVLAWILLNFVNVEAFGWRLPMFLFPSAYLQLGLYCLLAILIAAIWPAYRLAKLEPSTLLKIFANER